MGTIKFTEITVLFCSFLLGRTLIILQRSVSYHGRPLFWKACKFPRNIPAQQKLMEKDNIRGAMGKIE